MKKFMMIVIGLLLSFQMLQANQIEKTVVLNAGYNAVQFDANVTLEELKRKIGAENLLNIQGAGQGSTYKKQYVDDGLEFLNSFTQTEAGKAFWFKVVEDVNFTYMADKQVNNKVIALGEGWSFIGAMLPLTLEEMKSQLGEDNLLIIQGAGQGSTYKKEYVDNGTPFLNSFTAFEVGKGYWVKVASPKTLSFVFDLNKIVKDKTGNSVEVTRTIGGEDYTIRVYTDKAPVTVEGKQQRAVLEKLITNIVRVEVNGEIVELNIGDYPAGTKVQVQVFDTSGSQVARTNIVELSPIMQFSAITIDEPKQPALPSLVNFSLQTYKRDKAISPLVFLNLGGAIESCSVAPTLPTGLTLGIHNDTCEITGTPIEVTSLVEYTITGTNVTGNNTATVSIKVQSDNGTGSSLEFTNRAELEEIKKVATFSMHKSLRVNENVKFEIVEGLDGQFFEIASMLEGEADLRVNNSEIMGYEPTYSNPEDENQDNIYEVKVRATNQQTGDSTEVIVKFELISHDVSILGEGSISERAIVGASVVVDDRYTNHLFSIDKGDDITISSITLEGEGSEDFRVEGTNIKVVNGLNATDKDTYNLELVVKDSVGKTSRNAVVIHVIADDGTGSSLEFTNRAELEEIKKVATFSMHKSLRVNENVKFEIVEGLDGQFFEIASMLEGEADLRVNNSEIMGYEPTYSNPEDENQDNIYEVKVRATNQQTGDSTEVIVKFELISHDVSILGEGSISERAIVGASVVVDDRYTNHLFSIDKGDDITISSITLEGEGSEDFRVEGTNIKVVNGLNATDKDTYNLELVVTDSAGATSRNAVVIHVIADTSS